MISYGDFITGIRRTMWPHPGEASSLVTSHSQMFLEAMIDLCKWIPCLQTHHTDVHPACSTYVQCGLTVFAAPYGEIERVYTLSNGDWCNKVSYLPANYNRVQCWSDRLLKSPVFTSPANTGLPALQQGLKYAEKSTDSVYGRSRSGIYAVHRRRLYIAPWVQSNESVVVEWEGGKTDWRAEDLLDETYWTPDVGSAIKSYVQCQHAKDHTETAALEVRTLRQDYEDARADLIYWCQQRTKENEAQEAAAICTERTCDDGNLPSRTQLEAEAVGEEAGPEIFAVIGEYGADNEAEQDVADLIKGCDPSYIVTNGDNWYDGTAAEDLDAAVGKYFSDFLFPYTGDFGAGAATQRGVPALGANDFDPSGKLALVLAYFALSANYYTFTQGAVQFFVLNSGFDLSQVNQEADGNTLDSTQGNWLQAQLALSVAPFKIVIVHQPPFTSAATSLSTDPLAGDGTLSYPDLQWPFKDWGADVVISGRAHVYERLTGNGTIGEDGMIYIVNGLGGQPADAPEEPGTFAEEPLAISEKRYADDFGALRGTIDCQTLTLEFFNRDGTLIDSVSITK